MHTYISNERSPKWKRYENVEQKLSNSSILFYLRLTFFCNSDTTESKMYWTPWGACPLLPKKFFNSQKMKKLSKSLCWSKAHFILASYFVLIMRFSGTWHQARSTKTRGVGKFWSQILAPAPVNAGAGAEVSTKSKNSALVPALGEPELWGEITWSPLF